MTNNTKEICKFERSHYLELSNIFEDKSLDDVVSELDEFYWDIKSLAYELAYSRYCIAKLEAENAELKKELDEILKHIENFGEWLNKKTQNELAPEFAKILNDNSWDLYIKS